MTNSEIPADVLRAYIPPKLTGAWCGCPQNSCQPSLEGKLRFDNGSHLAMALGCCYLFVTIKNVTQDSIHTGGICVLASSLW